MEQNTNKFLFWPLRLGIFRIACRYLLHSLIFPHSLRIFKDFGIQITNTTVFAKIFIFQKWVLFPIWQSIKCSLFATINCGGSLCEHHSIRFYPHRWTCLIIPSYLTLYQIILYNGLVEKENKVTFSLSAIIYIYYNYLTSEDSLQIVTYILCKSNNCRIINILITTTSGALPIIEIMIITIKVKLITLHIFAIAFDFKRLFNLLMLLLISTISLFVWWCWRSEWQRC